LEKQRVISESGGEHARWNVGEMKLILGMNMKAWSCTPARRSTAPPLAAYEEACNGPLTKRLSEASHKKLGFIDQIKRPVWIFTETFRLPHFTLSASLRRGAALDGHLADMDHEATASAPRVSFETTEREAA
jgi:hypothetical protein